MRSFTDNQQREWKLEVTVLTVKRVREGCDVLLTSLFDDDCRLMAELSTDFIKLVDVLWFALAPDVDANDFAAAMGGDVLRHAMEALVRATADFFTSQDQRDALHKLTDTILATTGKVTTLATAKAMTTLTEIDTDQLAQSCLDFVSSGQASRESSRGDLQPVS